MNNNESNELLFTEAPASWITRYVDPIGFECQLTLRAETDQDLQDKVKDVITYRLENGCKPYTYNRWSYRGSSSTKGGTGLFVEIKSEDDSQWINFRSEKERHIEYVKFAGVGAWTEMQF